MLYWTRRALFIGLRQQQQQQRQHALKQWRPYSTPHNYLERIESTLKPRLTPLLAKFQTARGTLRGLSQQDAKMAVQRAGLALNQITGYDQIETTKHKVRDQAVRFEATRDRVQEAKQVFEQAIDTRSSTQREINELLQRKHLWTGEDVTRFTELYRLEHEHSRLEQEAKDTYQRCEKQMDREYMQLAQSIMERYHEEQLWSDKIRSVSTYGTWALMVVNLLLFVAVQTIFEPIKRRRLTDRFEELLVTKLDEEEKRFAERMDERDGLLLQQQERALMEILPTLVTPPPSPSPSPSPSVLPAEETASAEPVQVMQDDTLVAPPSTALLLDKKTLALYAVESAVAGSLVTALAFFLSR
ncbi:Mdm33 family-domain-containing protein [Syncephalastrum racemosum]|uniref:Sensitive to high expression protein 9, mitochondrial n=1 Tax=Syncephalastrum racemosum TaxID=13706 RepID=A0A1X2HIS4_SYNRA|nr:Mdm33 family-domain-containing protein [Syncephalastrum racemosum]